jgi:CubicO group peptidase (beta-lactamase class C family)
MRLPARSTRVLLAAVLLADTGACRSAVDEGDRSSAIADRIDELVAAHLANGPAASAAVAVVRGSDTVVMRGYGLAELSGKRPAGATTVYEIGSITKQFTAAAILQLAEQGRLALDDDLSRYVPTFPLQAHRVTIRQLLNHTSGIRSYTSDSEAQRFWGMDVPPDSIIAVVAGDPFDFPPGTGWRYNNTGYVLLGMIIEKVSAQSYAAYVEEQLFRPLRLSRTRYCPSRHARDTTFAAGYSAAGAQRQLQPAMYLSMTHPYAAGALCSSARDYVTWQRALHGGRVLNEASYRLMITPDTLANGQRLNYGFGLMTGTLGPYDMIHHTGGIPGFTTAQLYVPEKSLSVVVFTNTDAASPEPLALNIAQVVLGLLPAR